MQVVNKFTTYDVELACKERCPTVLRLVGIRRVRLEELPLVLQGSSDRLAGFDIALTAVDHGNISQP